MTTFVSHTSPVTGKLEWIMLDDNYDYHQEIARSAYADMLHDTERNEKYYAALKKAINLMHHRGLPANVLDIGTGTGLLSMMAVTCGADSVTACEAFKPMAECSSQIMKDNGMTDKINLIHKRSTELKVGPGMDMESRANILVTEVFDTELIGEGAIPTFHHAHEHLLEKDCVVVPSAANMYVQVVHSDFIRRWNQFQPIHCIEADESQNETIDVPPDVKSCHGAASVHDLQMQQIRKDQFTPLTSILKVFRFDYSGKTEIDFKGYSKQEVKSIASGTACGLFMWWDLEMDTENEILLSCAPKWAHPEPEKLQWRDHWMQAIYYPPHQIDLSENEDFILHSCHDDYSLWFDLSKPNSNNNNLPVAVPVCQCGAHVACSRTRLGMINDVVRNEKYFNAVKQAVTEDSICVCLGDCSLLPLIAAKAGAKQVFTIEQHSMGQKLVEKFIKENHLETQIHIIGKRADDVTTEDLKGVKPNLVLTEPYFTSNTLPWDNLYFWYARTSLNKLFAHKPRVMPFAATMKAVAVHFDDLWKIRSSVGNCEGFDISHFDKIIQESSNIADNYMEPHPLWEYPCKPRTDQFNLMAFDFSRPLSGIRTIKREGIEEMLSCGNCHGVVVWLDYHLDGKNIIHSGLISNVQSGEYLKWDPYTRQGVHLFKRPYNIDTLAENRWRLKYKVVFKPSTGEFEFKFDVMQR